MYKLCIWMNIPSHYQSSFFKALVQRGDIDLQVVYLDGVSSDRAAEGWSREYDYQGYELLACRDEKLFDLFNRIPDGKDRIHIISDYFSDELINHFCTEGIAWCHWSEMPGIRLAEMLGFRTVPFRLLNPIMLKLKGAKGFRIKQHALGAFGQGRLAMNALECMGVSKSKIAPLYYVPEGLAVSEPNEAIGEFSKGRNVFVSVGALCERKGVDVLLKAFAGLKTNDWCLVLCGLDRAEGKYQALCKKQGLDDQVLFSGAHSSATIAEIYAASDVFILSSRFDGWGLVLNEAASCSLPLIGTDLCGGSWHMIQDGENGFRVKTGSVASLRDAMQKYVKQPQLAEAHGKKSRNLFNSEFTPERNAERLVDALSRWSA